MRAEKSERGREGRREGGREGGHSYLDVITGIVVATRQIQAHVLAVVQPAVKTPGDPLVAEGREGGRVEKRVVSSDVCRRTTF